MRVDLSRPSSILRVHSGEEPLVALLLAHSFFIGWARIFTRTAGYALFLDQFDAGSLPYVYVAVSFLATAASFGYLRLSQRVSLARLLHVTAGFLALVPLALFAGLRATQAPWLVFLLPVWYEVLFTLTTLGFWNLAGRLCDVRQGKRLFGLIGGGEQVATAIGGFLVPLLVLWIGTSSLLLLAAGAMAGVVAVLLITHDKFRRALEEPARETGQADPLNPRALTPSQDRYIALLFGTFAAFIISFFFIDNIFYAQASAKYPGADQKASFIGLFFAVVALVTLFSQTLVTGTLLNRFGIRVGLILSPIFLLLLAGASWLAGLDRVAPVATTFFALVALLKFYDVVAATAIDDPVIKILYQALPSAFRVRAVALVDGIVYPIAVGVAGVGLYLLIGRLGLPAQSLLTVLIFILAVWLALGALLGRRYFAVLTQALARRRLMGVSLAIDDASTRTIALKALDSPAPGPVLYALNVLELNQPEELASVLPQLLAHPSPEVRQDVLSRIERLRLAAALPDLAQAIAGDPVAAVRVAAMRTLVLLDEEHGIPLVHPYLSSSDLDLSLGATVALLGTHEGQGSQDAEERLRQLAAAPEPRVRRAACEALREEGSSKHADLLERLLVDPDLLVRQAALRATARGAPQVNWSLVIGCLVEPRLRRAATAALAAGGQAALPAIAEAFRTEQDREVEGALARACGRMDLDAAAGLLAERLDLVDHDVRTHILIALDACAYRAQPARQATVERQIRGEVAHAAWLLAGIVDLQRAARAYASAAGAPAGPSEETGAWRGIVHLIRLLEERLAECRDRLLLLLSFIYDRPTVRQARAGLVAVDTDRKAYALEVIDILVAPGLKAGLLPLFENLPPEERMRRLNALLPQPSLDLPRRLEALLAGYQASSDPWLQASVFHAAGVLQIMDGRLGQAAAGSLEDPAVDPVVKESAAYALGLAGPEAPRLSTVEKAILLRTVSLFDATPDEILGRVAGLAREQTVPSGARVFSKGDPGDAMYIVVDGRLRVHDGLHLLNYLEPGDVFGEMALLDGQPRMASVTARDDGLLLRLEQGALFELMAERPEVSRGILRVLTRRLRARAGDLAALRARLQS